MVHRRPAKSFADQYGVRCSEGARRDGRPGNYLYFSDTQAAFMVESVRADERNVWLRYARHLDDCPRKGNAFDAQRDPSICTCGLTEVVSLQEGAKG